MQRIAHRLDGFDHGRAHLVRDDLALRQHVTPDLLLERVRFGGDQASDLLYVDPEFGRRCFAEGVVLVAGAWPRLLVSLPYLLAHRYDGRALRHGLGYNDRSFELRALIESH